MASSVCRERIVPEIPRLPIGRTPMRTGTKQRLFGLVDHRLVADHDGLQRLGVELRNDGAGAIDFLLFRQKKRGRAHFEGVHDLRGDAVQQLHHVAGFEQASG